MRGGPVGLPSALEGGQYRRRQLLRWAAAALAVGLAAPLHARERKLVRFGLTPVFLNSDVEVLGGFASYLNRHTGYEIELVQRRTYQEITALLLAGQVEVAWICGGPFVLHRNALELVAVPVWNGQPLYHAYVITQAKRGASDIGDLAGDVHAFSDPDSNSGHLVTRAELALRGRRPEEFFSRTIFTYGHRNVVRAVAAELAGSGSVDGYVWEVLAVTEPALTRRTRIVRKSKLFGFPPIVCPRSQSQSAAIAALTSALLEMHSDPDGRRLLALLRLDAFVAGTPQLFDGIANVVAQARSLE